MQRNMLHGTGISVILTLTSAILPAPAYAECIVEGLAYRALDNGMSDPTGPALYIKKSPHDSVYFFLRLRTGTFIRDVLDEKEPVPVRVVGSSQSCPTAGSLRDIGTATQPPQVIELTAEVRRTLNAPAE